MILSVGATLSEARRAHGLTLDDIADRTGIDARYLAAIEQGDYARFATPVYAVGFSRSYAKALGLSEAWIAERVHAEIADARRSAIAAPTDRDDPRPMGAELIRMVVGGAIGAGSVVILYWLFAG